ncbi:MAG: hypothetical protein MK100_09215, partial [Phycisphaerales bacterium]|nr:hypothetical protein [Phycisphaerales bacterium]
MLPRNATLISWLFCLLAFAGPAVAFPPSSISALASKTSLDDSQRQKIEQYAEYYVGVMEDGNTEDVMRARAKLIEPMTNSFGEIKSVFKHAYAGDVLPTLERIIETGDKYRSINALQVIGFLGTDNSLKLLEKYSNIEEEPSVEKRLWAVIAMREAIRRSDLTPRKIKSAARDLKRAAESETDWRVLTQQLETISTIAQIELSEDQNDDLRAFGREMQIEVVEGVVNRLKQQSTPVELIQALQPGITNIRQQYLDGSRDLRQEIGLALASPLRGVYIIVV